MARFSSSPLVAVLGPTNTGKTHLAVERMLAHSSGMIGFPLRLLAREIYDRVVAIKGVGAAALVTGEERIWPESARYVLSTVEAMPLADDSPMGKEPPAFVAIDEVQLAQDRERGHVFTARLLGARGREETLLLGSGSMAPLVRGLLPDADIMGRPRFSTLTYGGPGKLTRLPPRTVIVAFSAQDVYAIAETLRRTSGGAAVVMGALSPATRNAQVAMFQAGEVDYLVATDAIGMGLNLDVRHVAFASLSKFDGQRQRRLTIGEMAQIAGRAGRHQRDGTFGTTGSGAEFTPEEIAALEAHHVPALDWVYWRDDAPPMDDVATLIAALEAPPSGEYLRAAPEALDLAVLKTMQADHAAMASVTDAAMVRRLWATCSLPDFAKGGVHAHARLVARLWQDLGRPAGSDGGHVGADWFAGKLRALDDMDGSVEVLGDRLAAIRTLCYIAQRPDWLAEPAAQADAARQVESRLSDAMHAALTARFVDRRTSVLLRALGGGAADLPATVDDAGEVRVDGEYLGRLKGFAFTVDPAARADDKRMLLAAAERHLARERATRAMLLAGAEDGDLKLVLETGAPPELYWRDVCVATLTRGRTMLAPKTEPVLSVAALDPHQLTAIKARLIRWVDDRIAEQLPTLLRWMLRARDGATPAGLRALLATLIEAGGVCSRTDVDPIMAGMPPAERTQLRAAGIGVGTLDVFQPGLLKPIAQDWRAALFAAWNRVPVLVPPPPGIALIEVGLGLSGITATDFRVIGTRALRVDMVERMARHAHTARQAVPAAKPVPAANPVPAAKPVAVAATGEGIPLVDQAAAGEAQDVPPATSLAAAAPAPAPVPANVPVPTGGNHRFTIDPELGVSFGLTRAERADLLGQLGFRLERMADETLEVDQLWSWRGRKQRLDRGRRAASHRGAPQRQSGNGAGAARARSSGGPAAPSAARDRAQRADSLSSTAHRGSSAPRSSSPAAPRDDRAQSPPGASPFAGLADLLKGPPKG